MTSRIKTETKDKIKAARLLAYHAEAGLKLRGKQMKKDIQRAALAVIIGTLAGVTGCDQSNNSNMKGHGTNGKNGSTQDRTMEQGMDQGMDQSAKPMPEGGQSQMQDKSQQMQDKSQQMHGGGSSSYQGGNSGNKSSSSRYHYYSD